MFTEWIKTDLPLYLVKLNGSPETKVMYSYQMARWQKLTTKSRSELKPVFGY